MSDSPAFTTGRNGDRIFLQRRTIFTVEEFLKYFPRADERTIANIRWCLEMKQGRGLEILVAPDATPNTQPANSPNN